EMLLFRFQQPEEWGVWGNDPDRGFMFDWYDVGGHWKGWGRHVRQLLAKQHLRPSPRPIPRSLERNAVWSEDLARARLNLSVFPAAVVTPYGDWEQCSSLLPLFRRAKTA